MKARASIMGGLCILEEGQQRQFVNVLDMTLVEPAVAHLVSGAIDDWESVEAADRGALLNDIRDRHSCARCLVNIETCFAEVSPGLESDLLEEVEDTLKTFDKHNHLLAMLLRAPLLSLNAVEHMIQVCLSRGYAATAAILEQVRESQPHIRRLSDRWLSIPEEHFAAVPGGRQQVWRMGIAAGIILETLGASGFRAVENAWTRLAFDLRTPTERIAMAGISRAVARALFPEYADSSNLASAEDSEPEQERQGTPIVEQVAAVSLERALKQIGGITAAVAQGRDANARKYLRELVASQTAATSEPEHVLKSLCNIAQQCAEMFRTDFEYECLQCAVTINDCDAWTLIQLADHYKRVGKYDDAIETLNKAQACGEDVCVMASLQADVYVQMGQFDAAMGIYDSIPQAEHDPRVRTAKADVLRRWGRFADAEREYNSIISDGLETHRAIAGLAEIAKRVGRLDDARNLYRSILSRDDVDTFGRWVYTLALANVYLRRGELDKAYPLADEAAQLRPFSQQARVLRAAIAGLLGNPEEAIKDLPPLGQTKAFHEWVNEYVRGLLLLMLNRYDDARGALLQEVEERLLDKEAHGVLRLGAAVSFLRNRSGVERAREILENVPSMGDAFADAIRESLSYHVAISLGKTDEIARLEKQLASVEDKDLNLLKAAIRQKDWHVAWPLEVRALLRLAS